MEPDAAREHLAFEFERLQGMQWGFVHLHDKSSAEPTGEFAHIAQHEHA